MVFDRRKSAKLMAEFEREAILERAAVTEAYAHLGAHGSDAAGVQLFEKTSQIHARKMAIWKQLRQKGTAK